MRNNIVDKTKNYLIKLAKEEKTPHQTAMGFSIGTFIAILPSPGINILFCVIVALIYKKINKIMLFGSLAFWNTFLMIPIWAIGAKLGKLISGDQYGEFRFKALNTLSDYIQAHFTTAFNLNNILSKSFDVGVNLFIGTAILAIVFGMISYFVVKFLAEKYGHHKLMRHIHRLTHISMHKKKKNVSFEKKLKHFHKKIQGHIRKHMKRHFTKKKKKNTGTGKIYKK